MAHCFYCGQEITYLDMLKGVFGQFWRNCRRGLLYVFDCPHCETENQETWVTAYGFMTTVLLVVFVLAAILRRFHPEAIDDSALFLLVAVSYLAAHAVWWRKISITKEPHIFLWMR